MGIIVELTHEDDRTILISYLEDRLERAVQAPTSWSMPTVEKRAFERSLAALKRAKGSGIARSVVPPLVLEEERPQRTVKAQALVLCGQHPHYTAQRKPRTGCVGCWAAYKRVKDHDSTGETQPKASD